jgi:hypothetical protein
MAKNIIKLTEADLENIVSKVINEQESQSYGNCNGNNDIVEPKVQVKVQYNEYGKPRNVKFTIQSYFGTAKSSEEVYTDTLSKLKSTIFADLKSKDIKNEDYTFEIIEVNSIIGSASNFLAGPLKPTHDNNGKKMSESVLSQPPYNNLPGPGNSNWEKNQGYAESRWSNMLNYITTNSESLGFGAAENLGTPENVLTAILDTGGCIDEKRDISTFKNPGQQVRVTGTMRIEPIREDIECADGLTVIVGYFTSSTSVDGIKMPKNSAKHQCDYATFEVECNGIPVGISNMNNHMYYKNNPKFQLGMNEPGYVGPNGPGGSAYTTIKVPYNKIVDIMNNSQNGTINMTMEGIGAQAKRRTNEGIIEGYHGEAPMVCAFVKDIKGEQRIVYGPQEPWINSPNKVTVPPGEQVSIGSFNPCSGQ